MESVSEKIIYHNKIVSSRKKLYNYKLISQTSYAIILYSYLYKNVMG